MNLHESPVSTFDLHHPELPADADLIPGLRGGNQAMWTTVIEAFGPRMLAAAKRLLKSEHDAADAVQESFIAAFRSLESFRADSKLSTWLHRIVINTCLMKLRSLGRRAEALSSDLLPSFDDTGHHTRPVARWVDSGADSGADAGANPDERAMTAETRQFIRDRIEQLPELYRTVLILRDIEELDTRETARLLGVSQANVKTRLHRARQALRTLLEPRFAAAWEAD